MRLALQKELRLFLKRQPHVRFSNLLPSVEKQVNAQQAKQKLHDDRSRVKMPFGPSNLPGESGPSATFRPHRSSVTGIFRSRPSAGLRRC